MLTEAKRAVTVNNISAVSNTEEDKILNKTINMSQGQQLQVHKVGDDVTKLKWGTHNDN